MILHQRTHFFLDVPGCFGCKIASISIASSATPSRGGGARSAHIQATEKQWHKDMPAFKRLCEDGYNPPAIEGASRLEAESTCREHVETGHPEWSERAFKAFEDVSGHSALEPVA